MSTKHRNLPVLIIGLVFISGSQAFAIPMPKVAAVKPFELRLRESAKRPELDRFTWARMGISPIPSEFTSPLLRESHAQVLKLELSQLAMAEEAQLFGPRKSDRPRGGTGSSDEKDNSQELNIDHGDADIDRGYSSEPGRDDGTFDSDAVLFSDGNKTPDHGRRRSSEENPDVGNPRDNETDRRDSEQERDHSDGSYRDSVLFSNRDTEMPDQGQRRQQRGNRESNPDRGGTSYEIDRGRTEERSDFDPVYEGGHDSTTAMYLRGQEAVRQDLQARNGLLVDSISRLAESSQNMGTLVALTTKIVKRGWEFPQLGPAMQMWALGLAYENLTHLAFIEAVAQKAANDSSYGERVLKVFSALSQQMDVPGTQIEHLLPILGMNSVPFSGLNPVSMQNGIMN